MLPDILRYDPTKPRFYPNGRRLIEDIYSYRFAWLTYGKVPPQGLKPHVGLLVDFPYLGPQLLTAAQRPGTTWPQRMDPR